LCLRWLAVWSSGVFDLIFASSACDDAALIFASSACGDADLIFASSACGAAWLP